LLVDGVLDYAIFTLNARGCVASWNSGAQRIKGYTQSEILGKSVSVFYPPEDVKARRPQRGLFKAIQNGKYSEEGWRIRKDGAPFFAQVTITAIMDEHGALRGFSKITRDVTARVATESVLRENEELLRMANAAAGVGVFSIDFAAKKTRLSAELLALFGLPYDAENACLNPLIFVHPDDRESVDAAVAAANDPAGGGLARFEHRTIRPDGEVRWLSVNGMTIFADGPDGRKPVRAIGTCIDITARKRAEIDLQTMTDRFQAATEGASDGLWDWRVGSNVVWKSTRFWLLLGFKPGDKLPPDTIESWRERLHPDDLERTVKALYAHVETGSPYDVEYRLQMVDGGYRWFRARGVSQRDDAGKAIRMAGSIQDIHDRVTAQQELKASNAALEEAQAVGRIGAWSYDPITGKIAWSRQLFVLFDRDEALGPPKYGTEMARYVDPDAARLIAAVEKTKADGDPYNLVVQLRPTANGARFIRARGKARRDEAGRIVGLFGTAADVTAEVEREEALKLAREQAEAASRSKSEFLANMSHEIRTPMTAIIGFADLLDDPSCTPEQRAGYVRTIRQNGEHLLQIVNDILDISKIEAGKMTVENMQCSLTGVMAEVESLMRLRAVEKDISFGIEYGGRLPETICTDPTKLRQILFNLVGNAIKFTEHGGVRITVGVKNAGSRKTLRFDVADTGIGIQIEQQAQLFNSFAQADSSTTRRFGGTGLGLAISKRLAMLIGGELSVISEVNQGSVFSLSLDITDNNRVPAMAGGSRAVPVVDLQPPLMNTRILLAEDGADNRRLVTAYLEKAGCSVDVAVDGQSAVEQVVDAANAQRPFDLVLMDVQMPRLDGYGAARELRRLGYATLPIVALTAHAFEGERERCISCGCNDYAIKPVDPPALIATLRRHLKAADHLGYATGAANRVVPSTVSSERLRSSRLGDPVMDSIIGQYIEELPGQVSHMTALLKKNDLPSLQKLAHQIKGSGSGYGFSDISRLAIAAEATVIHNEPLEQIQAAFQVLASLIRRVEGYDRSREMPGEPGQPLATHA
jgi:PAS domain S-box-containing protein